MVQTIYLLKRRMKHQHSHTMSIDFGLKFSPIEPVSKYIVIKWKCSMLYQCHLRHKIFRVCFNITDDREVSSGVCDIYVDDLSVFAGCLNTKVTFQSYGNGWHIYVFLQTELWWATLSAESSQASGFKTILIFLV